MFLRARARLDANDFSMKNVSLSLSLSCVFCVSRTTTKKRELFFEEKTRKNDREEKFFFSFFWGGVFLSRVFCALCFVFNITFSPQTKKKWEKKGEREREREERVL